MDKNKNDSKDTYLGEGSFGCVLKPEIKCTGTVNIINKNSKKDPNNMVSKLFMDKEDFNKEIIASKKLKKVDKTGQNILLPYKSCETNSKEIFKNKEATKCEDLELYQNNNHKVYQLLMPYGGTRYDHYFEYNRISLKEFFSISLPLFKALIDLEKHKICHYDIRGANVLIGSTNKAIVIDHSLIIDYSKLYSEKNLRRLKKSYYPYPPECIVYYKMYIDKDNNDNFIDLQFEDAITSYGHTRHDAYTSIISDTDIHNAIINVSNKLKDIINKHQDTYKIELYNFMKKYANMVDVYSVGMLIVTVYKFIDYTNVPKNIKNDFMLFIKNLIHPDMFKRLTPVDALDTFNKLNMRLK